MKLDLYMHEAYHFVYYDVDFVNISTTAINDTNQGKWFCDWTK